MTRSVVLRRSDHVRQDGKTYLNPWEEIINVENIVSGRHGNYIFKVDGVRYHSRSDEWQQKLSELQTWSKLCTTTSS